jgi:hypothetical protein
MTAVMEDNDHPGDFHRDVKYIHAFLYVRQLLWLNQRGHRFVAQIFGEKYMEALLKGFYGCIQVSQHRLRRSCRRLQWKINSKEKNNNGKYAIEENTIGNCGKSIKRE